MAGRKKKGKKAAPKVVPGSGEGKEEPERSNVVRHLTAEEGWRFLFVRKGDELLNEQTADVNSVAGLAKSLEDAAALLTEKANTLKQIAQEKLKRLQAQRELWNNTHASFRRQLDLPEGCTVTYNAKTNVFDVIMLPPTK